MSDSAKNQPNFRINTVGNLNSGDVTIQGDQIGIQYHSGDRSSIQMTFNAPVYGAAGNVEGNQSIDPAIAPQTVEGNLSASPTEEETIDNRLIALLHQRTS
jgi:hypothetical protein